jgi:hypothetical protein
MYDANSPTVVLNSQISVGCYYELDGEGDELVARVAAPWGAARDMAKSNGSAAEGSYAPFACPHDAAAIFTLGSWRRVANMSSKSAMSGCEH